MKTNITHWPLTVTTHGVLLFKLKRVYVPGVVVSAVLRVGFLVAKVNAKQVA